MRARLALLLAAALLAVPAALPAGHATAAAAPRASLPDIEDEVMCPICGTLLGLAQSPQADRERVFIRRLIAAGRTKQQIEDALVAEYGQEVLAVPAHSGFSLSAYWLPIAGFAIAVIALGGALLRWRRRGPAAEADGPSAPEGEEAARLDRDLARYDL
ncbi:MAG: cytochrome c-type biogenesis protein CcmH [Solirubrobacterales bacterium]